MRVQFEILDQELNKLYLQITPEMSEEKIAERLNYIESFIVACGWDVDSYLRRLFEFDKPDVN